MSALPSFTPSALMGSLQAVYDAQASQATALRRRAWDYFVARGIPGPREEEWKYTSLQSLNALEFAPAPNSATAQGVVSVDDADYLTFVDGHYQAAHSKLPQQAGLTVTSLQALQSTPDKLSAALETAANGTSRFVALNTALTTNGVLIEVGEQVSVQRPLQLHFVWSTTDGRWMAQPRVVIRAGRYSKLTLLEHFSSQSSQAHLTNAVTIVELAEGAQLDHCRVQSENTVSFHLGTLRAEVAAQARLISHQFNLGAALGRVDIDVMLNGPAADVELNGLQFAGGTQHHDTHTLVEHCVPHTHSSEDYRGIADQRGRVVFNGKVRVHKKAIGTDAQQSSRNLLLAPRAEIDTKPELEIYADDVKCAHGATIGQLDPNALFYLRSRGLDAKQARALLTQAFADAVISRVPLAAVRNELTQAVHARFGASLEVPE